MMPVLFLGHGSPMNAIQDNEFTRKLSALGSALPKPEAILVVSAHWESDGTEVLVSAKPPTIHDFYGFPEKLFQVEYPAPGAPEKARETAKLLPGAQLSERWGLDHGTWSVLVHMFPQANIPVYQVSLSRHLSFSLHLELAKELRHLRQKNVLIIGSGNIVHNLRRLDWQSPQGAYDWNIEFDAGIKQALLDRDFDKLIHIEKNFPATAALAVPTPEHYLPLLYGAAVSDERDQISFPIEGYEMGSLSMRAVLWQP
jgi:4,5-DOPA dioxygenase extradiol